LKSLIPINPKDAGIDLGTIMHIFIEMGLTCHWDHDVNTFTVRSNGCEDHVCLVEYISNVCIDITRPPMPGSPVYYTMTFNLADPKCFKDIKEFINVR
jgi:hypothetical protein